MTWYSNAFDSAILLPQHSRSATGSRASPDDHLEQSQIRLKELEGTPKTNNFSRIETIYLFLQLIVFLVSFKRLANRHNLGSIQIAILSGISNIKEY